MRCISWLLPRYSSFVVILVPFLVKTRALAIADHGNNTRLENKLYHDLGLPNKWL